MAEAKVSLDWVESWSNVFGGKDAVFHVRVTSTEAFQGRAGWRFSTHGRTLSSREVDLTLQPGQAETVEIRLQVPEVKEGVIFRTDLSISIFALGAGREAVAAAALPIWVFPENPFAHQKERMKELKITLFDPEGRTSKVFDQMGIPYEERRNVQALEDSKEGFLLVGEGVSLQEYRRLPEALIRAAVQGRRALCLAPSEGVVVIPGMGDSDLPPPTSLLFRREDLISSLDKRLDGAGWPPEGKVAVSTLVLKGARGSVAVEVAEGNVGYSWLEMGFSPAHGKLVLCGFGMVRQWEFGPTPRFFLARLFEYLNGPNPMEDEK